MTTADATAQARRRYFPAVEGMRAVAALSVLVGHVVFYSLGQSSGGDVPMLGYWLSELGVVIFFAISGFLLYRPFVAARGSSRGVVSMTPAFLWRRAVRIFPAYWVALTVLALWPSLQLVFSSDWWVYYGLLQIYSPEWGLGGIGPAWSLAVELSFYLALPFIALFLARLGAGSGRRLGGLWEVATLTLLGLASVVWVGYETLEPDRNYLAVNLLGTFVWFSGGMLLAAVQVAGSRRLSPMLWPLRQPWLCWPLAAGLIAAVEFGLYAKWLDFEAREWAMTTPLVLAAAAALLVSPAMLGDSGRVVSAALGNRVMTFLGTISYGIYLWHFPLVIWLLAQGWVQESFSPLVVTTMIMLPGVIVLGTLSWYLVEKPLMRRARSVKAFKHVARETIEPPSEPARSSGSRGLGAARAPAGGGL